MSETVKQSRAEQILQALAKMLENNPGGKITTANLAQEVGVSEAALYRHFPSKARMFESLIEFIESTIFNRISLIKQNETDALIKCQKILLLVLLFAEKNPGLARMMSGDILTGEHHRLSTQINQLFNRLETELKQILRNAELEQGLQTQILTSASANLLIATVEGRVRQFVRSEFKQLPSEHWPLQWQQLAQQLFK